MSIEVFNEEQTIANVIADTKNQIGRYKLQERYFQRLILKGKGNKNETAMQTAQTQAQIRALSEYLAFLEEVQGEQKKSTV